ncbi:hypothetical protein E2C01_033217 [Portunus trituberculatus]|uniref:Uncharacterized protein n=1 Tax=Portunus trituberculatus TaxID=210409 RepID=A0A5B7EZK0_PORTR|nr:hypothetical protein [Portunus trituberculatus]
MSRLSAPVSDSGSGQDITLILNAIVTTLMSRDHFLRSFFPYITGHSPPTERPVLTSPPPRVTPPHG